MTYQEKFKRTLQSTPFIALSIILESIDRKHFSIEIYEVIKDIYKYYLDNNIAIIHKKPTPIKVSKVSYPNSYSVVIKEAFFEMPSTTDYNGIYKGKYIDFDAKEVKSNKSFNLSNIHKHQLEHLKKVGEEIIINNIQDRELIETMRIFF